MSAYTHADALLMAQLSALAYLPFESGPSGTTELRSQLAPLGFQLEAFFDRGSTEAFLARRTSDGAYALAFRGTQPRRFEDLLADLDADTALTPQGVYVHEGFYRAFRLVHDDLATSLARVSGSPFYLTGHSLGGALAILATWAFQSFAPAACYTFGSPRVAQSSFYSSINTPIYRVVNSLDAVPALPPADRDLWWLRAVLPFIFKGDTAMQQRCTRMCSRLAHFHHPPAPAYYIVPGRGVVPDTLTTTVPTARRWIFNYLKDLRGLKDHSIGLYVQRLAQLAQSGAAVPA